MIRANIFSVSRVIALVSLAMAGALVYSVGPVASASNTPTYVLGTSDPLDPLITQLRTLTTSLTILPAASDLALVGGNSILFVDGAWLELATSLDPTLLSLVLGKVLEGTPTVLVRGNPALLGDSVEGLIRISAPDLPLIAEGLKIKGTLADGTRTGATLQVLAGFDYAVETTFGWAEQHASQPSAPAVPASSMSSKHAKPVYALAESTELTSPEPYWLELLTHTTDTGDTFSPYGRISYDFSIHRLENDNSDGYKWFNFFMRETLQPGINIYNSEFRNSKQQDIIVLNSTDNLIVDHGPDFREIQGGDLVEYDIGVTSQDLEAAVTSIQHQSFFLKHATIYDLSIDPYVRWDYDIDSRSDSGKLAFEIIPGWTVRVEEDRPIDLFGIFYTTFDWLRGTEVIESQSEGVGLAVKGG